MQKNTVDILSSRYPSQKIRVKYTPIGKRKKGGFTYKNCPFTMFTYIIEWHSDVHQLVDAKMNQSTLSTVPKVRLATNDWLMDCLYCKFNSSFICTRII
jgi:hypothetical protein